MPVTVTNAHAHLRFSRRESERIVRYVIHAEGTVITSLDVVFVNHRRIIILNSKYLRKRRTTDVIAFRYHDTPAVDGEIFINLDQAKGQSRFYGVLFREEVARLLIHGVLHLIGYEDGSAKERNIMRQKEDFYLRAVSMREKKRVT